MGMLPSTLPIRKQINQPMRWWVAKETDELPSYKTLQSALPGLRRNQRTPHRDFIARVSPLFICVQDSYKYRFSAPGCIKTYKNATDIPRHQLKAHPELVVDKNFDRSYPQQIPEEAQGQNTLYAFPDNFKEPGFSSLHTRLGPVPYKSATAGTPVQSESIARVGLTRTEKRWPHTSKLRMGSSVINLIRWTL
jgi:hypothetical protein